MNQPVPNGAERSGAALLASLRANAERVGVALFAALFVVFLLQVFMRYIVNRPLGWSDEAALLLYPWAIFWACAFLVPLKNHVAFDIVYQAAAPRARRVLALIAACIAVGLFAAALPGTFDYTWFMRRERTPVLGMPYHYVFACFAIFLAAMVFLFAVRIWRLAGRRWRDHL